MSDPQEIIPPAMAFWAGFFGGFGFMLATLLVSVGAFILAGAGIFGLVARIMRDAGL